MVGNTVIAIAMGLIILIPNRPTVIKKYVIVSSPLFCRNQLQWGSEYRPFEYQKHLNTELFEVSISNSSVFKWSVYVQCPMFLTNHSNIRTFGIQPLFDHPTVVNNCIVFVFRTPATEKLLEPLLSALQVT